MDRDRRILPRSDCMYILALLGLAMATVVSAELVKQPVFWLAASCIFLVAMAAVVTRLAVRLGVFKQILQLLEVMGRLIKSLSRRADDSDET